jgi:hypothetical protein
MSRQARLFSVAAAALAGFMLLSASPAGATQAGKRTAESAAKEADEAPGTAGQKAAVDGEGKLRPVTAEEARTLTEGVARHVDQSSDGLVEQQHASGAVSMDLDDRFQSVSLARLAGDGSVSTRCVTSLPEARRFLGQDGKTPPPAAIAGAGAAAANRPLPARAPARTVARPAATPAPLEEK